LRLATRCALLGAALLLCACAAPTGSQAPMLGPPSDGSQAPTLALRADGRLVQLAVEPGPAAPAAGAIARDRAVAAAATRLGVAAVDLSSEARLVNLSVRVADDGTPVLGRRLVWLVQFRDLEFAATLCTCGRRPATAVAVDALDGTTLASYGVDG
jgi:hypothetical protein